LARELRCASAFNSPARAVGLILSSFFPRLSRDEKGTGRIGYAMLYTVS
jgi:hypothetical protein